MSATTIRADEFTCDLCGKSQIVSLDASPKDWREVQVCEEPRHACPGCCERILHDALLDKLGSAPLKRGR